jgi:predicted RNA binding protein YcfA (HicA-like mRNA interferase family)
MGLRLARHRWRNPAGLAWLLALLLGCLPATTAAKFIVRFTEPDGVQAAVPCADWAEFKLLVFELHLLRLRVVSIIAAEEPATEFEEDDLLHLLSCGIRYNVVADVGSIPFLQALRGQLFLSYVDLAAPLSIVYDTPQQMLAALRARHPALVDRLVETGQAARERRDGPGPAQAALAGVAGAAAAGAGAGAADMEEGPAVGAVASVQVAVQPSLPALVGLGAGSALMLGVAVPGLSASEAKVEAKALALPKPPGGGRPPRSPPGESRQADAKAAGAEPRSPPPVQIELQPNMRVRELLPLLNRLGWTHVRDNGSHRIYRGPNGATVPIPGGMGDSIPIGTLRSILNITGLRKRR